MEREQEKAIIIGYSKVMILHRNKAEKGEKTCGAGRRDALYIGKSERASSKQLTCR